MSNDLTFGVRLAWDGKQAVTGINETQSAMDKLSDKLKAQAAGFAATTASLRQNSAAVTETSGAVAKLLDRYDPLGAKLRQLQTDFKALDAAAGSGKVASRDDARLDTVYAKIQKEITAAKGAAGGFGEAANDAFENAAKGANKSMFATVGARRELMVLAHEAISGNFARMPGSFMVLAERTHLSMASLMGFGGAALAVAASAAVMLYAVHQGAEEMHAMDRALASTSNFAGLTRGEMRGLAADMSSASQLTIGQSKEVVTELAASGRIGAAAFGAVAGLVDSYARATGQSAAEATPKLIQMFEDPTRGAEQLNKSMHFLTVAQMNHIRALQESGKETEAQLVLADALKGRISLQTEHIGTLSSAWNSLRKSASGAWDSMMGVGRAATLEEKIAGLRGKVDTLSVQSPGSKEYLKAQDELNKALADREKASASATQQGVNAAKIDEANKANALILRYSVESQKEELRQKIALMQQHPEIANQADAIARAKKQLSELGTKPDRNAENDLYRAGIAPEEARQKALGDLTKRAEADRKLALEAGEISQADYIEVMNNLRDAELRAQINSYRLEESAALAHKKKADAIKYGGEADAAQNQLDGLPEAKRAALAAAANKQRLGALPVTQSLDAAYRKTDESRSRALELDIMTESERRLAQAMDAVNDRARAAREALDLKFPEKERQTLAYQDALAKVDAAQQSAAQSTQEWAARQDELNASWEHGADKALRKYLDQVGNTSSQAEQMMTRSFKGMEDAVVQFAMTGKLQLRDFANMAIQEFYRVNVARPLVGSLSGAFQGWFGGEAAPVTSAAAFAPAESSFGSMFTVGMHTGGIVGQDSSFARAAPISLWTGASRYHAGGIIGPGERPIIAQDGEEMLTRTDPRHRYNQRNAPAASDVNVTLNIIGAQSAPQVEQRPDGNGGMTLDIIFEKVDNFIADGINSGRGATAVSLTRNFGLNRAAGTYR